MHVSTLIVLCLLGGLSGESQMNAAVSKDFNATTPVLNCRTAQQVVGSCVKRETCNFGPGAIDFTLYAPRGYKRPCEQSAVCCPLQHIIVQATPSPQNNTAEDFKFDDDD